MSDHCISTVGIVGAGVMGRGIAQLALSSGMAAVLVDSRSTALQSARDEIDGRFRRLVEKGTLSADEAVAQMDRLSLRDELSALSETDLIIEAIVEDLDEKTRLLSEIESRVAADTLLASNTSSFLISEIAADARYPDRFFGLHFFNPAPLMRLVEVVAGQATSPDVLARARAFVLALGHTPVMTADVNGFIANQLGRGYVLEAARLAEQNVASFKVIDRTLRAGMEFPMGPFELMDLTGLDVTYPASRAIWEGNGFDERLLPPSLLERRFKSGLFGKKNGKGFRTDERICGGNDHDDLTSAPLVWAPAAFRDAAKPVLEMMSSIGVTISDDTHPPENSVLLLSLEGERLLTVAQRLELEPTRCIGFDPLFPGKGEVSLIRSSLTDQRLVNRLDCRSICFSDDGAGTICQRIALQLGLIAGDMVARGVATADDIDRTAMLALGHATGPLKRITHLGAGRMESLRARIFEATAEARFRPSRWLTEAALSGT